MEPTQGSYAVEPPGETHTFVVPEDAGEVIALFNVIGGYVYVDPQGVAAGIKDVFTKLEVARGHYRKAGIDLKKLEALIR